MEEKKNEYTEILKLIKDTPSLKEIRLAQDFIEGKMFYGFKAGNKDYVINSDKEIISTNDLKNNGLKPMPNTIIQSFFPIEKMENYLNDQVEICPSELFNDISSYIQTYIYLPDKRYYSLLTIWVMGTYVFRMFRYYPYIQLTADKGTGKTTLMEVLKAISFNGDFSSSSTAAVIYREIEANLPTMFLDEFERKNKLHKDGHNVIMEVLKSGFSKSGIVKRCEGESNTPKGYSSYSPKMIAGIQEVDEILRDRVITIIMTKQRDGKFKRYIESDDVKKSQKEIRENLYFFGLEYAHRIFNDYKIFEINQSNLEHLNNRMGDMWIPLLVIAKIVSGTYYDDLIALSRSEANMRKEGDQDENEATKILEFIHNLIDQSSPIKNNESEDSFTCLTKDLLALLQSEKVLDENYKGNRLSRKLKELFNIESKPTTIFGKSVRKYDFEKKKVRQVYEQRLKILD